jgi:hypothetical protein
VCETYDAIGGSNMQIGKQGCFHQQYYDAEYECFVLVIVLIRFLALRP